MEKKLLLLLLYIAVLLMVNNKDLMKVQENRGFYIDIIDPHHEELFESSYCIKENEISNLYES